MQAVMVHIDSHLGPIGGWSYQPATRALQHFYPESLDLSISGRARQLMAERGPGDDVVDWMNGLTRLSSGLDKYLLLEVADNVPLLNVISDYRRLWNSSTVLPD